jgi:hypothetical protein
MCARAIGHLGISAPRSSGRNAAPITDRFREIAAGTSDAPTPAATNANVVSMRGDSWTMVGANPRVLNMAKIAS